MFRTVLLIVAILLAGCVGPAQTAPGTTSESAPNFEASPPMLTCPDLDTNPDAKRMQPVATREPGTHTARMLVAHRDGVAYYEGNGTELALPKQELLLGFSDDLGYRFINDGSAVYDDASLHRFDAALGRTAWWNSTGLGGAYHHGSLYYATAAGKLYVLSDSLVVLHSQPILGWAAADQPRFDVLLVVDSRLLIGPAGGPERLLVYDLSVPTQPTLAKEIPVARSELPKPRDSLGQSGDPNARQTPWAEAWFAHMWSRGDRVYALRDGAYQNNPGEAVERFQDLITIHPSDWSVERVEQQYLEDNRDGIFNGWHVGPIDPTGTWALLQLRGMFSLANMLENGTKAGCQIDIQLSGFTPEDAFFHQNGSVAVTGTQSRANVWALAPEPARLAEIGFPKVITDVRSR